MKPTNGHRHRVFKPASEETAALIGKLNEEKRNTFFIPTGFISPEAGQVGYLLNYCFNRGRDGEKQKTYKTFFVNSRFEALHGAIKIARVRARSINRQSTREILIHSPAKELKFLFDPLNRGQEKALIPGIRIFEKLPDLIRCTAEMAFPPAAVVINAHDDPDAETVNGFLDFCREKKIITILDESDTDFRSPAAFVNRVSLPPDVIITGEALCEYEIPFAAFSMSEDTFTPWNNTRNYLAHTSTGGGNRLSLTRVRDYILKNVPFPVNDHSLIPGCKKIEESGRERLAAFSRFVNPALAEVYALAGLDIHPLNAHGSTLTIRSKGKNRDLLDCVSGGGVAIRGHTPDDIVPEVLRRHHSDEDYWGTLCRTLTARTGLAHAFPAVSGSTAVEIGMILAMLANKDKTRIIVFKGNYSGSTLLSLVGTEEENLRKPFFPLYFDVLYIDPLDKSAKQILLNELTSQEVALVWFEVFQGQKARGIPGELLDLISRNKEKGGYFIGVDEILTGLYRMGTFLASENKIPAPDIVTLFKGLTDATFPCGVTLVSSEVYRKAYSFKPRVVTYLENVYVNRLGSHIALHLLEKMDSYGPAKHVQEVSGILRAGLNEIARASPFIKTVEGGGLLFRITYNHNNKILAFIGKAGRKIWRGLLPLFMCRLCREKAGILLYFNALVPALDISRQQAHELIRRLKRVFTAKPSIYLTYLRFYLFLLKTRPPR
jgi:acetylornithine/succinyldiaminopimelate/putrescine aminotransferase